jgi:hypothetical protein
MHPETLSNFDNDLHDSTVVIQISGTSTAASAPVCLNNVQKTNPGTSTPAHVFESMTASLAIYT